MLEEESLYRRFDTQLVVPLATAGRIIGFMLLGEKLSEGDTIKLVFFQPEGYEIELSHLDRKTPKAQLTHHNDSVAHAGLKVAAEQILELTVPLGSLARRTDHPVHFFVQLFKEGKPVERVPAEGAIETAVPSPDYELIMWQA